MKVKYKIKPILQNDEERKNLENIFESNRLKYKKTRYTEHLYIYSCVMSFEQKEELLLSYGDKITIEKMSIVTLD